MAKETIFVVEDEEDIQELVKYNLAKEGYQVQCAGSGEEGLKKINAKSPDLVILDLMLPGIDGLEVCKTLRSESKTKGLPVLMLTAKGEEADVVTGLELGADDYLVKPFSPRVLLARVKNLLRRKTEAPGDENTVLKVQELLIHPGRHEVLVKGKPVELTFTGFRILHLLARRPGWVFTRQQIVDAVRGHGYPVTDRSVDVHIVSLRRKLGAMGKCVETVRGIGYRFKEA